MECDRAELELSALFDRAANIGVTPKLRAHLSACVECREIYAGLYLLAAFEGVARTTWGRPDVGGRIPIPADDSRKGI